MMDDAQLPLDFRKREVKMVFDYLLAGDSCSLVGIGSVGKSNFLRFLLREDLHREKLGETWMKTAFVYVDGNKLLKKSQWGIYELMLHQLLIVMTHKEIGEEPFAQLDQLHTRATLPKTQHLALRYLDRALSIVCKKWGFRIVFLFDEFDELYNMLPGQTFSAFRALRDEHKYELMYVVATRIALPLLVKNTTDVEAFEELVTPNTVWLGPYLEEDALWMVKRLSKRYGFTFSNEDIRKRLAITGGHPGLLRAVFQTLKAQEDLPNDQFIDEWRIRDECQRIWLSLSADEQKALTYLANGQVIDPLMKDQLTTLKRKGLIDSPWVETGEIFSPLFKQFIKKKKPIIGAQVTMNRQRNTVFINGQTVQDLTNLEYLLIDYLEEHRGTLCTKDELAAYLYPDDMKEDGVGVTDARIESVVKRLRSKFSPFLGEEQLITTVRGRGYRLDDGETPDIQS